MSSLKSEIYNFHDRVKMIINTDCDSVLKEYLTMQYSDFNVSSNGEFINDKIITINIKNRLSKKGRNNYEIKDKQSTFIRHGEWFIWKYRGEKLILNGVDKLITQNQIDMTSAFDKMKCNLIIDLMFRLHLIKQDIVLIHSAAVSKEGKATLLPAWKASGKTKYCLKLIEEGFDFLADDKVWIGNDLTVYSYPRYVVIKNNNIQDFKKNYNSIYIFYSKIIYNAMNSEVFSNKYIDFVLNRFQIKPRYFKIIDLYPDVKTINTSTLTEIIFLLKGGNLKLNRNHFAKMISDVNNYEWNNDILNLASAHDYLFPDGKNWFEEILEFMTCEKNTINDILLNSNISINSINVLDGIESSIINHQLSNTL